MSQESSPQTHNGTADKGAAEKGRAPTESDLPTRNLEPPQLDLISPQFTLRAVLTGMVLGGLFSICNVYVGLKIGVGFPMSITAALVSYGFWSALRGVSGRRIRAWGILENNINQTACSSSASVASAGLVAAIPALTLLTGQTLEWQQLARWVFSVMLVGIVVAIPLRRQMIVVDKLPFPAGIASAEMLREVHARGAEALARVKMLISAGLIASVVMLCTTFKLLASYALPFSIKGFSARSLTMTLNPSLLPLGIGGLIGFRACCSLLIGTILAYAIIAPPLIQNGYIAVSAGDSPPLSPSFRDLNRWLLWPGVTLMVVASLVSLCLSLWPILVAFLSGHRKAADESGTPITGEVPRPWFGLGLLGVLILSVVLQVSLFGIAWWAAVIGVLLAFALALVATRVTGETGIGTVGPIGKVAQLAFGFIVPRNPVPNLMAANVAGGAASQCADLMDDLKCGYLLGASPRLQTLAQLCGASVGALVGSAAYLILIPNPSEMLMTEEWAAPAVAAWKAVAELFMVGFKALPKGVPTAMALAALVGIVLPVLERCLPNRFRPLVLSPISIGLAFVYPAHLAFSIFIGGLIALTLRRWFKTWSARFLIAMCVGVIAGESFTGIGIALEKVLAR